jgi:hypothetical protein
MHLLQVVGVVGSEQLSETHIPHIEKPKSCRFGKKIMLDAGSYGEIIILAVCGV